MNDRQPVPECATCGHEHSAAWTRGRLTATGPCHCGCRVETRSTLSNYDRGQVWLDDGGRIWEWSDLDGWVVDGMASFGGFEPLDGVTFTKAFTGGGERE